MRLWRSISGTVVAALLAPSQTPPHYQDVARELGIVAPNTFGSRDHKRYILETTGNGAAILDLDGDGWNDILITNGTTLDAPAGSAPPLVHLYRNNGSGRFTEIAAEAGLRRTGWGQAVCAGDYDNDGRTDLLLTYYGHNSLYQNQGGGKFRDVTGSARLPVEGTRWGSGCAFLDYDRDGFLDLFVANYVDLDLKTTPQPGQSDNCKWKGLDVMCGPSGLPRARNALYKNNRDGTFTDVSSPAGILKPGGRYSLGVLAADFDNDGWTDIYVACDMTPSLLYRNRHDGTFEERGGEAGVAFNFDGRLQAGMGVATADFDGNGYIDIAKTNFSGDLPSLYLNEDGKFFTDVSPQAGLAKHQLLGWGALFIDADEDGWPDLLLANGHVYPEVDRANVGDRYLQKTLLYRNLGNSRFADITDVSGPAFAALRPARGVAAGDIDGDGRPEIVIVNMNERPSVLRNSAPRGNAMIVGLKGTKSNRSAIGARVIVEAGGRKQIQEVLSGGSYYSQSDLSLHFGLGEAKKIDRIEVRWPSGAVGQWKDIAVNGRLKIQEGSDTVEFESFRAPDTKVTIR